MFADALATFTSRLQGKKKSTEVGKGSTPLQRWWYGEYISGINSATNSHFFTNTYFDSALLGFGHLLL